MDKYIAYFERQGEADFYVLRRLENTVVIYSFKNKEEFRVGSAATEGQINSMISYANYYYCDKFRFIILEKGQKIPA